MKQVKKLIIASIFLAITIILSILEIQWFSNPIGLALDFSLAMVFLARRVVGNKYTFIIAFIYPWFSMMAGMGGLVGAIFLLVVAYSFVIIDLLIFDFLLKPIKNKTIKYVIGILVITIVLSLFYYLINILVFIPAYSGFDYSSIGFDTSSYFSTYAIILFPFNIAKLVINLVIGIILVEIYNIESMR